jgi:histidinol dehydrogenase
MKVYDNPSRSEWERLCQRPVDDNQEIVSSVRSIIDQVREEGDSALRRLTYGYDSVRLDDLEIAVATKDIMTDMIDQSLKDAIGVASLNIERFHKEQQLPDIRTETMPGVECRLRYLPLERVGLYIPGGSAPLFSTVLMLAIPAALAGCREVILCTPPMSNGSIDPVILYAASVSGVDRIFRVGGAQAIAAMAFGTETVPRVDKIFGPGNQYVTMAKQYLNRHGIAIDLPAGPSEVAVIADCNSDPSFVAADLLAQAEHGPDSQVILVATDTPIIKSVSENIEKQLIGLPRRDIARKALEKSLAVIFSSTGDIMDFVNQYAPEHLIISTQNAEELAGMVMNAGSVFIGEYTPESAGDYASGTNHTLPTNGFAKAWSGVTLSSFQKSISYQMISGKGLTNLGPTVELMAEAEGLLGHKNAVSLRLEKIGKDV